MTLWKINCMEDSFPGMWQRWYRKPMRCCRMAC